jgi:leader peptidase (prepilin peptidase)/N-methyltransferase
MIYIFLFVFGTIIGSFLNVVILRYNTGESLIFSGSRCFSCGKKLSWYELIPIFSFLIQGGKCRECKSKISLQYPLVEALTGIVFVLIFWKVLNFGFEIWNLFGIWDLEFGILALSRKIIFTIYLWLVFSLLILIAVYDLRHQIIPNAFVYTLIILSLFAVFFETWDLEFVWDLGFGIWKLAERIFAGFGMFAFFGLLWRLSKGQWMGLGDAKLALAIGWLLGFVKGLFALLFSFWFGAALGVFLLLFIPKKFTLKSRIPFGPFLCFGTILALLWGDKFLEVYLRSTTLF